MKIDFTLHHLLLPLILQTGSEIYKENMLKIMNTFNVKLKTRQVGALRCILQDNICVYKYINVCKYKYYFTYFFKFASVIYFYINA